MATKVDIGNMALRRIGETRIESFTEQSDNANILNDIYDINRKAVLREYPWSFAVKTAELVATSEEPPDWNYEFALPADLLYLLSPAESGRDFTDNIYEIRGSNLYTDDSEITVRYVYDITDTSKFDSLFVTALSYLLASELAMPRTGDPNIQGNMAQGYTQAITKARGMNGSENKLNRVADNQYVNARR